MRYEVTIYSEDYYGGWDKAPVVLALPDHITTEDEAYDYIQKMAKKMNLTYLINDRFESTVHCRSERGYFEGKATVNISLQERKDPPYFDNAFVKSWNEEHPDNRDQFKEFLDTEWEW